MIKYLVAGLVAISSPAIAQINLHVDRSDLQITVKDGQQVISQHPTAMGKPTTPTPLGSYWIHEVHINPGYGGRNGYIPPGPRSPMGRVRFRYDFPYALHGTNRPESIGTYASLGCIRMDNRDVIELARTILKDTGNYQGDAWFQAMLDRPGKEFRIKLSRPISIKITE